MNERRRLLEKNRIPALLNSPLWQNAAPPIWQEQFALFASQLLELDASFIIWRQWLEARIAGKPIDLPLLEQWLSCTQALKPGTYQHKFNAFRDDFC